MSSEAQTSARRSRTALHGDYTLVIPTYNRPRDLARNLAFHDAQGLKARILVLDSSRPEIKEQNKRTIGAVPLDVEHLAYDPATHPFDKFADGVHRVTTPYMSLCADDDLLLIGGLDASLAALDSDKQAEAAHGYYFLFGHLHDATSMDITTMLYASPGIVDSRPLERLRTLMRSYQALTYAVMRSDVAKTTYQTMTGLEGLMFRELISSAVPVLRGRAIRVPHFFMARAHATGDDAGRKRWHPLEWLMRDSEGLMREYAVYRERLADVIATTDGDTNSRRDRRLIDLIHAGYLFKHLPDPVQDIALARELEGGGIDTYWGDHGLQMALVHAHNSAFKPPAAHGYVITKRVARVFPECVIDPVSGTPAFWPVVTTTPVRNYRFYGSFLDNQLSDIVAVDGPMVKELVNQLDLYPTD